MTCVEMKETTQFKRFWNDLEQDDLMHDSKNWMIEIWFVSHCFTLSRPEPFIE